MKIVLTQDVANLGSLGDQVDVKPGYARNYLIPQNKAIAVSGSRNKQFLHQLQYLEKLRQDAVNQAQSLSDKLSQVELTIAKIAGENGKLFGSVTNRDLEEILQKEGFDLTRRNILSHAPIKNIGTHTVPLKLHTQVKAQVTVHVVEEKKEEPAEVVTDPAEMELVEEGQEQEERQSS